MCELSLRSIAFASCRLKLQVIALMLCFTGLGDALTKGASPLRYFHSIRNNNDISFSLPDAVAASVQTFISGDNTCPATDSTVSSKLKRIPEDFIRCLVTDAEDIVEALSPIGELASLFNEIQAGTIIIPAQPAAFADEGAAQAFSYLMAYAGARIPNSRPGVPLSDVQTAGLTAFYIVYSYVFSMAASNMAQIIINQAALTTPGPGCIAGWKPRCANPLCEGQGGLCTGSSYFSSCPCDDKACPSSLEDSLRCPMDCGGSDSNGKCLGDAQGNYKGCDCVPLWDVPLYNAVEHDWEDITGVIAGLPTLVSTAKTVCNPPSGDTWTYGPAAELAVKLFCADPSNLTGQQNDVRKQQYGMGTEDDIIVKVTLIDPSAADCPRSGTNVYGGSSQMPNGASAFDIFPNGGVPTLQCDPSDPPFLSNSPPSYKVALNRDGMTAVYNNFCDSVNGTDLRNGFIQDVNGPFGGAEVPNHQNVRTLVRPQYSGNAPEGCANWNGILRSDTCKLVFGMLTDKCDPDTNIGKRGGHTDFECINWQIDGYQSTADTYRLHIHQQMVDDFSQIEWTLYDSRGTTVSGPSTNGTVTGAPQNLDFHIDSPTKKDSTNVRMFYPAGGKFQFSTGWTGSSGSSNYKKEYYCDDILDGGPGSWNGWQDNGRNGFERQFDCFFRGWGNNDGDVI